MCSHLTTWSIRQLGLVIALSAGVTGCIGESYSVELVNRSGGYEVSGSFASLDECRRAANGWYDPRRHSSWSCLKSNGNGGYASRYR